MKRSENITNLIGALLEFQKEVTNPIKSATNTFLKGAKYAPLPDILQLVRPLLSTHGLVIVQDSCSGENNSVVINCTLFHSSGEWMEFDPLELTPVKTDPQSIGSTISYGRRYKLQTVLNIAADEDDDGSIGSGSDPDKGKVINKVTNMSSSSKSKGERGNSGTGNAAKAQSTTSAQQTKPQTSTPGTTPPSSTPTTAEKDSESKPEPQDEPVNSEDKNPSSSPTTTSAEYLSKVRLSGIKATIRSRGLSDEDVENIIKAFGAETIETIKNDDFSAVRTAIANYSVKAAV